MNHVSLVGPLADAPTYPGPSRRAPARAAFTVGPPRRRSIAVDWTAVTAVSPRPDAVAEAGPGAGNVVVVVVEGYLHATSPAGDGRYQLDVGATHVQVVSPAPRATHPQEVTP